jgi:hypothetical protein
MGRRDANRVSFKLVGPVWFGFHLTRLATPAMVTPKGSFRLFAMSILVIAPQTARSGSEWILFGRILSSSPDELSRRAKSTTL